MHYLSYASALCDELSSSSDVQLMPVLKEQIFSILPEMALEPEDPSASGVERRTSAVFCRPPFIAAAQDFMSPLRKWPMAN